MGSQWTCGKSLRRDAFAPHNRQRRYAPHNRQRYAPHNRQRSHLIKGNVAGPWSLAGDNRLGWKPEQLGSRLLGRGRDGNRGMGIGGWDRGGVIKGWGEVGVI